MSDDEKTRWYIRESGKLMPLKLDIGQGRLVSMKADYDCLKCNHRFEIGITESDLLDCLDASRTDVCPECGQCVGMCPECHQHIFMGPVRCRDCGNAFVLALPHWNVRCNLAKGACTACGTLYMSLCIC